MGKLMEKEETARKWPEIAVETTVQIIGGKWKGIILYHLIEGEIRFNQLRRQMPGITQRMLTLQLRDLEKNGIIDRIVYQEIPPRVGYRLSELGRSLVPLVMQMKSWGEKYQKQTGSPQA
ncbi:MULTISPECIES: winged helix-turn-helix transcriptional regulator [Cohnella]|uniref:winged helix-turn-helix transcriptional regulator n=1 Tax=Cohnella TaxID=329857 RepID=UPI0009BB33F5|nr:MULTISPECIES: helix-turn-helix domain-containing protein [Cohnella]MBN2980798.1 helix-turn-helix transcriptional regulator [Cohnella algarum]